MPVTKKKIYALYDNGVLMGHYTALEASLLTSLPCATISAYANSGGTALKRYTIKPVENINRDQLANEWEQSRHEILTAGRR